MEQDKQEQTICYETVKAATIALVTEKGRDTALALLDAYGVSKAMHIPVHQWGEYLADVGAILRHGAKPVSMTPTLDKLEARGPAKSIGRLLREQAQAAADSYYANRAAADPNAAMIARDGPAKPAAAVSAPAPKSTAHKPLPALSLMSVGDHRLGQFSGR